MWWFRFLLAYLFVSLLKIATAQTPQIGYFFPPAIQRGSEININIGGYDFTPDLQTFVLSKEVTLSQIGPLGEFHITPRPYWQGPRQYASALPIAREIPAALHVPKNVKLGLHHWQVANANGHSSTGVFLVTNVPEILEDRVLSRPQQIDALPVGISGRLSRITEIDSYQFVAQKDGPMTIDVWARRLGSDLNAAIKIKDAAGSVVVDEADTEGQDLTATFEATKGERYTLQLHDTDFRGSRPFVYRVEISDRPRILRTVPAKLVHGSNQNVQLTGWGLQTGKYRIETIQREIQNTSDRYQPLHVSVKTPTDVTMAFPFRQQLGQKIKERIAVSGTPLQIDANEAVWNTLDARTPNNRHSYSFSAQKDQTYEISAESIAIGTDLDMSIEVWSGNNKLLENDDQEGTTDASVSFQPKTSDTIRIVVRGIPTSSRNDVDRTYRLEVARRDNGFALRTAQAFQGKPGEEVEITVTKNAFGGFAEAIHLQVFGLPSGVSTVGKLTMEPGDKELKFRLKIDEHIPVQASYFRIAGTVKKEDGKTQTVPVTASVKSNLCSLGELTEELLLNIKMDAPFEIKLIDKNRQRVVHRGTTYPAPFQIERNGFDGEILMTMKAKQSRHRMGIRGPTMVIPKGATSALYPCFMPEWISTARTSRMEVLTMAQINDPKGNPRYLTKTADARITMICEGALLKVEQEADELTVAAGDSFKIPVKILRNSKLQTDVQVELIVPEEFAGAIGGSSVTIPASTDRAVLIVKTNEHSELIGLTSLTIQATTLQQERWPVRSIVDVEVDFR